MGNLKHIPQVEALLLIEGASKGLSEQIILLSMSWSFRLYLQLLKYVAAFML